MSDILLLIPHFASLDFWVLNCSFSEGILHFIEYGFLLFCRFCTSSNMDFAILLLSLLVLFFQYFAVFDYFLLLQLEMPNSLAELSFVVEMPNDYYKERRFEWCFLLQLDGLLSSKGHCM
ncbi:hypothetical protein J1N35_036801 [Gossypium stocksii]|uniref:Uncharacterized protein n=1 Tax=Gossypium stocksii TaxID=47602 RepID=A0A9D3UIL6_9ROSI|nr:hypothetical protein J1N35_036801 [Gossypium stocksii]